MKRFVFGAAAAGGAALALRQLVRKGRAMHDHCREMLSKQCGGSSVGCRAT